MFVPLLLELIEPLVFLPAFFGLGFLFCDLLDDGGDRLLVVEGFLLMEVGLLLQEPDFLL